MWHLLEHFVHMTHSLSLKKVSKVTTITPPLGHTPPAFDSLALSSELYNHTYISRQNMWHLFASFGHMAHSLSLTTVSKLTTITPHLWHTPPGLDSLALSSELYNHTYIRSANMWHLFASFGHMANSLSLTTVSKLTTITPHLCHTPTWLRFSSSFFRVI